MCGIVGYIGHRDAYPIILKGLQRLEYRGYDSAGIALYDGNTINLSKTKGKVSDLQSRLEKEISIRGRYNYLPRSLLLHLFGRHLFKHKLKNPSPQQIFFLQ